MKYIAIIIAFFLIAAVQAKHTSDHPLSEQDWKEVMEKVVLLEDSGLMPTLLPVIMRNRDALQLTEEQISAFQAWRKKNYTHMVNIMNLIIEKLSPGISADQLLALQSGIQELQRELLKIKLTCREMIMTTFTDEQWDNFAFVVSDNPRLANLILQGNR
jgi:hypothetical protein